MIVMASYPHIRVAGVTFYNEDGKQEYRQTIIDDLLYKGWLAPGQRLRLMPKPHPKDPNAVKVIGAEERQIGFIPRLNNMARTVSQHISSGKGYIASVNEVTGGANGVGYEVYIDIQLTDTPGGEVDLYDRALPSVRINEVKVDQLFGLYDYVLNLNEELSIIHALNGAGKTTIMRLLSDVLEGTTESISHAFSIPFLRFSIVFSDRSSVTLDGEKHQVSINHYGMPSETIRIDDASLHEKIMEASHHLTAKFISANRIWDLNSEHAEERVRQCAENITALVRRLKESIMRNGEVLDTSFPYRVFELARDAHPYSTYDEINRQMELLETRRKELCSVGLVQDRERHLYEKPFEIGSDASPDLLRMMTTYVRDMWAKYNLCNSLNRGLELLQRIINEDHEYADKRLEYHFGDAVDPIAFRLSSGLKLPLSALSSGEKNDFVMFCELIFESKANTIVLLDEPEISMHVAWQLTIIDELLEIAKMNNFQILVATHSPSIVNEHWDLAIDLQPDETGADDE